MGMSFGVNNSKEFFDLLLIEVSEFLKNDLNIGKAISCAMIAFHLTDWLNKEVNSDGDLGQFRIDLGCPELFILHDIINGSKHFEMDGKRIKQIDDTYLHEGAFSDEFSDEFDVTSLDIKLKDRTVTSFREVIIKVTDFWDTISKTV